VKLSDGPMIRPPDILTKSSRYHNPHHTGHTTPLRVTPVYSAVSTASRFESMFLHLMLSEWWTSLYSSGQVYSYTLSTAAAYIYVERQ
jgi:hypothetical protein